MKNKIGIAGGFIIGTAGFLLLFKLMVLDYIAPSDELAPGIVVGASILNGVVFAFIGYRIQGYVTRKRT